METIIISISMFPRADYRQHHAENARPAGPTVFRCLLNLATASISGRVDGGDVTGVAEQPAGPGVGTAAKLHELPASWNASSASVSSAPPERSRP